MVLPWFIKLVCKVRFTDLFPHSINCVTAKLAFPPFQIHSKNGIALSFNDKFLAFWTESVFGSGFRYISYIDIFTTSILCNFFGLKKRGDGCCR